MSEKIWNYKNEKNKELKAGKLLLAEPFMADENFSRSVILICEHDAENGTMGLILNKPIQLLLNEVVTSLPAFDGKVNLGGPVGTDTMQFLHKLGSKIEGSVKLADGLYWGGNFEQIKLLIENNKVQADDISFYIGYSGWESGQLQVELETNSWIISEAKAAHIFEHKSTLWRDVLRDMGDVYEIMAGYPESPILN